MSRLESGGTHHPEKWRADVRIANDDLIERLVQHVEEHNVSKSDLVRNALDEYVEDAETSDDEPRIRPPRTENLRRALEILQELARDEDGAVDETTALAELAQKFGRDKEACKRTLISPLVDQGYVVRKAGWSDKTKFDPILPEDIPDVLERQGHADVEEGSA